jgi:quinol monooxygenase YgiN
MPSTVHVLARFVARPGKEDALRAVLSALIAPTRRELQCYQYDLLVDSNDPRQFCFVERWDGNAALEEHLATPHVKAALAQLEELVESPPEIRRYTVL